MERGKQMKKGLLFAIMAFLSACSAWQDGNYDAAEITVVEKSQIAHDAAEMLAKEYPPGKTNLVISGEQAFTELLQEALRKKGFAMQESSGVKLKYILDRLADKTIYLALMTDSFSLYGYYVMQDGVVKRQNLTKRDDQ